METLRDRPEVNFGKIATYLPSSRSLPQVGARMRPLGKLATMTVPPTAPWWKKIKPQRLSHFANSWRSLVVPVVTVANGVKCLNKNPSQLRLI